MGRKRKKGRKFSLSLGKYKVDFLLNREEISKSAKFLFAMAIIFFMLDFIFSIFLAKVEFFVAQAVSFILSVFGVASEVVAQEPALILIHNPSLQMPIAISYLCTGILETALLTAAIAASFGISIKKRLIGIFLAFLAIQAFNLIRILATIFLIINFNLAVAELGHEIFFRIFLLVAIAGIYAAWFWWATLQKKNSGD